MGGTLTASMKQQFKVQIFKTREYTTLPLTLTPEVNGWDSVCLQLVITRRRHVNAGHSLTTHPSSKFISKTCSFQGLASRRNVSIPQPEIYLEASKDKFIHKFWKTLSDAPLGLSLRCLTLTKREHTSPVLSWCQYLVSCGHIPSWLHYLWHHRPFNASYISKRSEGTPASAGHNSVQTAAC